MTRQPNETYEKAMLFAQLWEEKYVGETYIITGKDLKYAKELKTIPNDEIVRRLRVYLKDDWYGENCGHSLAPFVQNINNFIPAKREDGVVMDCPLCGKSHAPHVDCSKVGKVVPMPKEVGDALTLLAKKMSAQ